MPRASSVGRQGIQLLHRDPLHRRDGTITDAETGSSWSITGQASAGPLAGSQLEPVVHGDHFWFAWAAFQPDTVIWGAP